jgi:hypothetical protein
MKRFPVLFFILLIYTHLSAQQKKDTIISVDNYFVTLSPVIIDTKLNVPSFIERVKSDTSFYKAFKNIRILGYSAINDIRMFGNNKNQIDYLHSRTKQIRQNDCRIMQTIEEEHSENFYDLEQNYNYYTAQLYASLFFTSGKVCGENNTVGDSHFSVKEKKGLEKHKEQLKMLFFNPGKKISGLPFISGKTAIFDDRIVENYDLSIDMDYYNKTSCFVFKQKVKLGKENDIMLDEMTTWFNDSTFEVVARNYSLSYDAGFYDFNVNMEVQMTQFKNLMVPSLIRYNGNWKTIFKKRERGVFTATLFDFE